MPRPLGPNPAIITLHRFAKGGPRRAVHVLPPLAAAALQLVRTLSRDQGAAGKEVSVNEVIVLWLLGWRLPPGSSHVCCSGHSPPAASRTLMLSVWTCSHLPRDLKPANSSGSQLLIVPRGASVTTQDAVQPGGPHLTAQT